MTYANLNQAILPRIDFRAAHDGKYPTQLQGADLSYAKMPGALSDQANLRDANLQGAWLPRAELRRAQLQGAILKDATLQNAILQDASLEEGKLQDAHLQNAHLQNAHLQGAILSDANLQGANLSEVKLQGAILRQADLRNTDLTQANLQGADLTGAKLKGAKLNKSKLEGAILSNTDMDPNQRGLAEPESPDYKKDSINYLMTLACTNNYIAEGLVNQIIQSDRDHGRASLAEKMKKVVSVSQEPDDCLKKNSNCPGICKLPNKVKESLNSQVTSPAK